MNDQNDGSQPPAPSLSLYHYCSASGLYRIFSEGYLSATHAGYFNDKMEIAHAALILAQVIASRLNQQVDQDLEVFLRLLLQKATKITTFNIFVFCFSENGDLLSQWRGYCPKEGGYSIGFNFDSVVALAADSHFILRQCIYDLSSQQEHVENLVDQAIQKFHVNRIAEAVTAEVPTDQGDNQEVESEWIAETTEVIAASLMETPRENTLATLRIMGLRHGIKTIDLEAHELAIRVLQAMDESKPEGSPMLTAEDVITLGITEATRIVTIIAEFIGQFIVLAPTLKDPSFSEEKEWRLISLPRKLRSGLPPKKWRREGLR